MRNLTATLCLILAVLLGSAGMSASANYGKGLAAYKRGDYATALREWSPLAVHGNTTAQLLLGEMYKNGWGVPQNDKTAVKWYRLAAEQGDADAQFNLGLMYGMGRGVIRDPVYAHMWYNIAASNGVINGANVRNAHATVITPSQLEKAQDLARECVRKDYKGC